MSDKKPCTQNSKAFFDRDTTSFIKGIAIILMFIHHFFTMPDEYISSISYPHLYDFALRFCFPMKICVAIFAFLTGYFYAGNKNKTAKYSINKMLNLLINYWLVLLVLGTIAYFLGDFNFSGIDLIYHIIPIKTPLVQFAWYVTFYLLVMIIMPIIHRLLDKNIFLAIGTGFVIVTIVCSLSMTFNLYFLNFLYTYFAMWFPALLSGYVVKQYNIYEKYLDVYLNKKLEKDTERVLLWILLILIAMFGRVYSDLYSFAIPGTSVKLATYIALDTVGLPLFIFAIVKLRDMAKVKYVDPLISNLGQYSMYLWLLHSIFFGASKEHTQPVLFFSQNPVLVLIWGFIMCYAAARIIDIPAKFLTKSLDKLFKK